MKQVKINMVTAYMEAASTLQRRVAGACATQIVDASLAVAKALRAGHKVLLCGNGGSAADCQHMATELVSRMSRERDRPALSALALTTDSSLITAYGNDYGFDGIFERQVEALGREQDVLIAISTSGRSKNVRRAVLAAKRKGMTTIGLMGAGGPMEPEVDFAVVIPDSDTQHVQEALLPVEHLICWFVERELFGDLETKDER